MLTCCVERTVSRAAACHSVTCCLNPLHSAGLLGDLTRPNKTLLRYIGSNMYSQRLLIVAVAVSVALIVPTWTANGQPAGLSDTATERPQHLMFVSYQGRSHMMPYLEILRPLADRGHKVTIVTDHQAVKWLKPAYSKYQIRLVPNAIWDEATAKMPQIMAQILNPKTSHVGFASMLEHISLPYYKPLVATFKEIFTKDKPDFLLCDYLSDACADVADTLGVRYGVTISGLPPGVSEASYINSWSSTVLTATTLNMSLWQRLYNKVVIPVKILTAMHSNLNKLAQIKKEIGIVAPSGPPGQRFARVLKLVNSFIGFEAARPVDPLVQLVGPIRSHVNNTMPDDIQQWINNLSSSSKRVIYVAFGTNVDVPQNIITSLMTALVTTLDQGLADGLIWAVSNTKRDRFPAGLDPRVLLVPFAPQKALLASADVCLFVSHGGAESAHEAMYEAKPLLVIPFYGDQPMNAARMSEAGYAEFISHHDVTAARVQAKLTQMLKPNPDPQDPSAPYAETYAAAARRQQALVRTLIKHNTEAAADMLLFFARYGYDHLIPAGTKMPWYKATDADMYAVLVVAVLLVMGSVVWGLWRSLYVLCGVFGVAGRHCSNKAKQS